MAMNTHTAVGSGVVISTVHTKGVGKDYVRSCFNERLKDDRFTKKTMRVYPPGGQIGACVDFTIPAPQDDFVDISNLIFELNVQLIDTATKVAPLDTDNVRKVFFYSLTKHYETNCLFFRSHRLIILSTAI